MHTIESLQRNDCVDMDQVVTYELFGSLNRFN